MPQNNATSCVWEMTTASPAPSFPPLQGNARAEITIIGAGFCGLSAALHLGEAGRTVVVLDAHGPGWGASGRNGGHVIPGFKLDPDQLIRRFGADRGKQMVRLTGDAPDLVFDLIDRYGIPCSPRRTGWIQLATGPNGMRQIKDRVDQWRRRGADVELLDQAEAGALTGAKGFVGGMLDRRGGNLNPLGYARGLAEAATSFKVTMYGDSRANSIRQVKGKWVVHTERGQVTSGKLLLCTNAYSDEIWPGLRRTIVPFVSGAVATEPLAKHVRETILAQGQAVADNSRLLSWFGLDRDGRLIFGGRTATWSETNTPSDYRHRIKRMHEVFPQVTGVPVVNYWSGKVALTPDYLPRIHRLAADLYAGLGFNGRGVAMATVMGKLLAGKCLGRDDDPDPFPVTPLKPIPFHALRRPVVQGVVWWKKLMDRINP